MMGAFSRLLPALVIGSAYAHKSTTSETPIEPVSGLVVGIFIFLWAAASDFIYLWWDHRRHEPQEDDEGTKRASP